MPAVNQCPTCRAELPPESPAGLCPACLLKAGMTSDHIEAGTRTNRTTFTPPTPAELASHFPQLEILEIVGQGGMGAVYKAKQVRLDRFVALKILPKDADKGQEFINRFNREAKAMARLSHPNIIAIHDYGEVGGWFYFVMEYVDGVNLRQAMRAGAIQPPEALVMVGQICDALQYAHEESVVHRDIKPENILVTKKGRLKIADFGLAKLLGVSAVDRHLTATQQVMGTLGYMAPEQMEGSKSIDHRADIYALGVVFYELLTGELPMGRFAPPSQKVQIDVRIDEVVLKTLEREPNRRYQSASQIKHDVEHISAGPTTSIPISDSTSLTPATIEALKIRLPILGSVMLILSLCDFAVVFGIVINAANRGPAAFNFGNVAALFTLMDFVVLGTITGIAGLLILFRILRPLALLGVFATLLPLATIGTILSSADLETMRFGTFIRVLDLIGIPIGIWGLIELNQPQVKAQFRWPLLPLSLSIGRFVSTRLVNITLLTLLAVGLCLIPLLAGPWSTGMYAHATGHGPMAGSLIAVISLFLIITWPFASRPTLWRPIITLFGGLALFAVAYDYSCNRMNDAWGTNGLILSEGWTALLIISSVYCFHGAWGCSRWLSDVVKQPAMSSEKATTHKNRMNSLVQFASAVLVVFSLIGLAMFMGWIHMPGSAPNSMSTMKPNSAVQRNDEKPRDTKEIAGIWASENNSWTIIFFENGSYDEHVSSGSSSGRYSLSDYEIKLLHPTDPTKDRRYLMALGKDQMTLSNDFMVAKLNRTGIYPPLPLTIPLDIAGYWINEETNHILHFREDRTYDEWTPGKKLTNQSYSKIDGRVSLKVLDPVKDKEQHVSGLDIRGNELKVSCSDGTVIRFIRVTNVPDEMKP